MRAVIVKPKQGAEVFEVENTLEALQRVVDGYIETVSLPDGLVLICNEEGKLRNLPPNRCLGCDIIAGDFIIVSSNEDGDFVSLSEAQITKAKKIFG